MSNYSNENSGVLFKNDKKQSEKHPDYNGSWTDAAGKEFWLSAWINEVKDGRKYMKLQATEKEAKPKQHEDDSTRHRREPVGYEEDIPF